MARKITEKMQGSIRKSAKAIEASINSLDGRHGSAATVAGLAGVAVAGAAAAAVAFRRRGKGRGRGAELHVTRNGEKQWVVTRDGAEGAAQTFATKKKAVRAARSAAAEAAPIDLVIHRVDGSVEESQSYDGS
jgi:hypothetical protein